MKYIITLFEIVYNFFKKDYYFIYYNGIHRTWKPELLGGIFAGETNENYQELIDIHPLQWQYEMNKKYSSFRNNEQGYKVYEIYKVISWQKISKKEYKTWKDTIG